MDLKARIEELKDVYDCLQNDKLAIHEKQKEIKKKIAKYETVLKHAEEIEGEGSMPKYVEGIQPGFIVAAEDIVVDGVKVKAGDKIWLKDIQEEKPLV